jgi:TPP-dependent 2-oxoacid decarboxylase
MMILKLFIILNSSFAEQVIRLDNNTIESFTPFSHKYELIIEENCAHCINQINILKNCVEDKDVVILMDNKSLKSQDELKKILRKKKITYKTLLLNKTLIDTYAFKGITPTIWINTPKSSQSYSGVATCDFLKSKI